MLVMKHLPRQRGDVPGTKFFSTRKGKLAPPTRGFLTENQQVVAGTDNQATTQLRVVLGLAVSSGRVG